MAQRKRSPARLGVFLVRHARNRRNVESRLVGDVLQNPRAQVGLVAFLEEATLPVDDGFHRHVERVATLFHGLDEALRLIDFLLRVEQRLLRLAAHSVAVVFVGFDHLRERRRHRQFGHATAIQRECHRAVVRRIDDEVGRDLLQTPTHRFAERSTGFRVQFSDFVLQFKHLLVAQVECNLNFPPMFLREGVEMVAKHPFQLCFQPSGRLPFDLQQQTFLQVPRTDARRVESL